MAGAKTAAGLLGGKVALKSMDSAVGPTPLPAPVPQLEGHVDVADGHRIWYFDTGGLGSPIVLLHAGVGSGLMWGYQQPVFAAAGHRVIGYSRRARERSIVGNVDQPGVGSEDLLKLADALELDKFHLLGTAAGGMVATDFAVSHESRLLSLTLANTIVGITNSDYRAIYDLIWPEEFFKLPNDFKELGPSYRHLDAHGRQVWSAFERTATIADMKDQTYANMVVWDHLMAWKLPVLIFTGDADLYAPPSMMRLVASRISGAESHIIPDCGHSAYWERPEIFNRLVLDFITRHDA
jgi:pimeloyl-ACP methyl ester carboxylesterase